MYCWLNSKERFVWNTNDRHTISWLEDFWEAAWPEVCILYLPVITSLQQKKKSIKTNKQSGLYYKDCIVLQFVLHSLTATSELIIIKIIIMWALQTPLGKKHTHTHTRVAAIICMCAWVCMSHRGVVGPLRRKAILGPLDVCRRLGPTSHTGQVVWSTSHQQELRGSLDHWVLRWDWRGDMQIHILKWHIYVSVNT